MRYKNSRVENVSDNVLELITRDVRAPMSKTQAMCAVRPERRGKAGTHPDAGDCYGSIIISEFSLQRSMRLTHGMQIKSVADVTRPPNHPRGN